MGDKTGFPRDSHNYACNHPIKYYSEIILTKLVTYYSQDYADIIGAGLFATHFTY